MPRPSEGILATQKYSFYILFTLKFPGMSKDTPKLLQYLWEAISWISVFVPLHMSVCFLKTVHDRFDIDSADIISNTLMQGAWLFCSFLVMLNFKLKAKDLDDLLNIIEDKFQWRSARGKTYVDMEKLYRYAKIIGISWQIIPPASVISSLIRPLLKRPVKLPVATWYPVNMDNDYQFAVVYFFQAWAQMIVVCGFVAGSAFSFSFGLMCAGQFNILRCALKNLLFTSGVYKRFPETVHICNEEDSAGYFYAKEMRDDHLPFPKPQYLTTSKSIEQAQQSSGVPILSPEEVECYRRALINCVEHHLALIRICGLMKKFISFFSLMRVVELTLQVSFMVFVYSQTSDLILLAFGVLAAIDIFILTYPADHIRDQAIALGESLMMGPWYLVSKHFRTDFLIIIKYSEKPIIFTASNLFVLNADRLRKALTTAFSYYTLLSSFEAI